MDRYNFKIVEQKWQDFWEKNKSFKVKTDPAKKKFYCLEMFPYPSGKIHMGHVRNYTIGDVLARYKFLKGYNVLHPMGWDSFGMPAENAAKQNNLDPKKWTETNILNMKSQLKKLGLSIDWDREISTCSDDYYKHQQRFFLELLEKAPEMEGVEYEQNGLQFYSIYELAEDDPDGYITFSITLIDSAGNSTGQVIGTDDGSSVWYDGTVPTMSPVSFHSTNVNNDDVAVPGDTLILDFTSSESLSNISVSIAGIVSEINLLDGFLPTYQSKRILDGSEDEGVIPFRIIFSDLVGNDGDAIITTTDGTSILFDMTPPAQFTLDSSYSSGGNIIPVSYTHLTLPTKRIV